MTPLDLAEDYIGAQVRLAIPDKRLLVAATSLPGAYATAEVWTEAMLKGVLQYAPGVLVTFQGLSIAEDDDEPKTTAVFVAYVITKESAAIGRRPLPGGNAPLSAHDIIAAIVPALHNFRMPNLATLRVRSVVPLFGASWADYGCTVHAVHLSAIINFDVTPLPPVESDITTPWAPPPLELVWINWDVPSFANNADHTRWMAEDYTAPAPNGLAPDAQDGIVLEGGDGSI